MQKQKVVSDPMMQFLPKHSFSGLSPTTSQNLPWGKGYFSEGFFGKGDPKGVPFSKGRGACQGRDDLKRGRGYPYLFLELPEGSLKAFLPPF